MYQLNFVRLGEKSDQTFLVILGHFCESKEFKLIKLVHVYQPFPYTNHISNKNILFKITRSSLSRVYELPNDNRHCLNKINLMAIKK